MTPRNDITELLQQGLSDRAIARQLHCDAKTVARTRATLGLPKARSGKTPAPSIEAAFRARTEPVEGGHLRWTGSRNPDGHPTLRWGGKHHSVYRIAFQLRHRREPEGNCLAECDLPGCVAPEHIDDHTIRTRDRAVLAALTGQTGPSDSCRRGHPASEHRAYGPSGRPYCRACNRTRPSRGQA